jgi:tetratricopeptide (TPR) repeat protein
MAGAILPIASAFYFLFARCSMKERNPWCTGSSLPGRSTCLMRRKFASAVVARVAFSFCRLSMAAVIFLIALSAHAQPPDVERNMRLGVAAMEAHRYKEAEQDYRDVVALAPNLPAGHLNLGLALLRQSRLPEAIASLETAARLAPRLPGPHMFLAIAYLETARLDAAKSAVDEELRLTPDEVQVLTLAGTIAMKMGDPAAAIDPLDHASRLSPNDLDLLDLRGRAYQAVAKQIYQQMYQLAPDSWQVHQARARLFEEDQRHKEAAEEYEAALRLNPSDLNLYDELAQEYRRIGDLDQVEHTFVREKQEAPDDPRTLLNLASIQIERGRASEGLPLVQQVLKTEPNNPQAYFYLGRGLAEIDRGADAITALGKYLSLQPDGDLREQAYYTISRLYRKQQKPEEAQKALSEFQRLKQQREAEEKQQIDAFRKQ